MKKTNAIRILERQKISYKLLEYTYDPENLDVGKIARDNGFDAAEIYKTLVVIGDKTGPVVAVVPGDMVLNLKTIAKVSGNKRAFMAPTSDLEKLTGYIRGGCSPVGMKKQYPVFIDQHAEELGSIWVNAGTRGILFSTSVSELIQVTRGTICSIAVSRPNADE